MSPRLADVKHTRFEVMYKYRICDKKSQMKEDRLLDPLSVFEFFAFWRDGVTAAELGQALGMTREAAQRSVVGPYKKAFPHAMVRRGKRTHIDGDTYSLRVSPWRVLDVVNFTSAMQAFADAVSGGSPLEVPIEDLANLLDIDNEVERFRELYAAIARRCAIYLDYAAKRGRIQLIFSPHAVVRTPTRLHFRGHSIRLSEGNSRYIDVVPGRIISSSLGSDDEYVGAKDDIEWHTRGSIVAELNPRLPETVRESVMREHQCGDQLTIENMRYAVAEYVVDWLKGRRLRGIIDPVWVRARVDRIKCDGD